MEKCCSRRYCLVKSAGHEWNSLSTYGFVELNGYLYSWRMPDPRIERTRVHVLTTARALLAERNGEPLTFSRLAEAAQVSRRTLYTHWGSVERVIADAATFQPSVMPHDLAGLSKRELLTHLIESVRDRLADPVSHVAVTSLVAQASMDAR